MKSPGGFLQSLGLAGLLVQNLPFVSAQIQLDVTSTDSLKNAAKTAAKNMMTYYTGNQPGQTPGVLPQPPYFWWEAGAMWGALIEYWSLTGDDQYNEDVKSSLLFQTGPDNNFEPPNQTLSEGNDDQVFWAFAAMSAAELKFPNPDPDQPQWLELAQAVFNRQAERWDASSCGGGLRWQFNPVNNGFDYKNTISNGGFFQLGARLARYTNNATYANWAERTLEWILSTPIVTGTQSGGYDVLDGGDVSDNCQTPHEAHFTYNYGTWIAGCSYLYDWAPQDQKSKWAGYLEGFMNGAIKEFFPQAYGGGQIMSEIQCEQSNTCNYDQTSFKAYLTRWMAIAALLVPGADDKYGITAKFATSAAGAAKQCSGNGDDTCGTRWYQATWDGNSGVGEQMSAMNIFANNLIKYVGPTPQHDKPNNNGHNIPVAPLTSNNGGTSKGNPAAGTGTPVEIDPVFTEPITTGDKAGAGILTTVMLGLTIYLSYFLVIAKDS